MTVVPYFDADALAKILSWPTAIEAISTAVAELDTAALPARTVLPTRRGELMLMPAESAAGVGVKVLTIAPDNPSIGRPRIQGLYIVFDSTTLTPRALIDGAALTAVRTASVSAFAISRLARPDASTLVVFGSGPQAESHIAAIRSIRPLRSVVIVGRDRSRASELATRVDGVRGVMATVGSGDDIATADIVVCATTARTPLFDGSRLADDACVVAVGSHEPDARELDAEVFRRATRVVVEDADTAQREAGDVIQAIAAGTLDVQRLIGLDDLAPLSPSAGMSVFKSVGMAWQDLALADAVCELNNPAT